MSLVRFGNDCYRDPAIRGISCEYERFNDDYLENVKSKVVVVTPKKNLGLSPLQLWEAIEKAGKEPVKLTGPGGTFTSKPKK
jgi:hypothetical protein